MRRHFSRRAWLAPILLVGLAAALRFWALNSIPPGFHYDEAFEALEAWRVLNRPGYHPIFFPGNFGVEPVFVYLTALAFRIFGETPTVMRGLAALIGTLTIPALYGLGQELLRADSRLPRALPWLAALVMALSRWHILFSRTGIEPILVPLAVVLLCWAFWWALRSNRPFAWVLLGVVTGLGPYTYPAGRLLPLLLAGLVALVWLTDRGRLAGRGRGLWLALGVALVVVAPLAWHFIRQPDQLILRSSQIAVGPRPVPTGGLGQNILAVLGMFSIRGDADPRSNLPGLPAVDLWLTLPFYLGLVVAFWRWRRPAYASLPLTGLIMLLPTVLSEFAPHFRRALGASPSVALLTGLGLALILSYGIEGRKNKRLSAVPVAFVVLLLVGSLSFTLRDYFWRWGNSPDLYYAYDEGLWEIGNYVRSLPPDQRVYITPRPAADTTLGFAWRDGPDVRHFDGRQGFIASAYGPDAGRDATYIIIEHEDDRGANVLRDLYPQATEDRQFLDRNGRVYARAYRVPAMAAPARLPDPVVEAAWPDLSLTSYELSKGVFHPGDIVTAELWWRATGAPATDWTAFIHLIGPEDAGANDVTTDVWAGHDGRPGGGSTPTSEWQPGDIVLDLRHFNIPKDTPPGVYSLEAGIYDPSAGNARARLLQPAGQDHVILGKVLIQ